jgi:hypothetical protein
MTSCPQKRALLHEYLRKQNIVLDLMQEYVEAVACGLGGVALFGVKERIAEARKEHHDARTEYAEHRRTHACEAVLAVL